MLLQNDSSQIKARAITGLDITFVEGIHANICSSNIPKFFADELVITRVVYGAGTGVFT